MHKWELLVFLRWVGQVWRLFWVVLGVFAENVLQRIWNIFEFQVAHVLADLLPVSFHQLFHSDMVVVKDLQMVCYQMSHFTVRTRNHDRSLFISLLRHCVRGPRVTFLASEGNHHLGFFHLERPQVYFLIVLFGLIVSDDAGMQ